MCYNISSVFEQWHTEFLNLLGALDSKKETLEQTVYSLVGNRIEELIV